MGFIVLRLRQHHLDKHNHLQHEYMPIRYIQKGPKGSVPSNYFDSQWLLKNLHNSMSDL